MELADEEYVNWEWLEQGRVPNSFMFHRKYGTHGVCWMMTHDRWPKI